MKSYLKYGLTILLAFSFGAIFAQIRPGYVFGINLSTMTMKTNGISYNAEMPIGFHFGGSLEIPVTDFLALQPSLLFSAKGSDFSHDTLEFSLSPVYIDVPINVLCSFGTDALKVCLFAGPYFAVGIGGYKIDAGGNIKDINYGSGANDDMKPFDFGFNFGAGVNIKGLLISAQYGIGLKNISPVTTFDSEMKNNVIGISIRGKGPDLSTSFGR
jgi:hypothetical protein